MINLRNLIAIGTIGATMLGFSSIASARPLRWHGPIYRPVRVVFNPVLYAPVPVPPCGLIEPVAVPTYRVHERFARPIIRYEPRGRRW